MNKHYHVYGLGAALVDTEINVSDNDLMTMSIEKGVMTTMNEAQRKHLLQHFSDQLSCSKRTSGGSTANAMIAIAQFGGQTFYSCKVGNDSDGYFYLNDLKMAGVDYQIDKTCNDGVTGACLVMITPDAERTLNSFLGVSSTLSQDDVIPGIIVASDYIYFEAYTVLSPTTRAAAIRMREVAEQNGVKTALSFSDPRIVTDYRDDLQKLLGNIIDLIFCNKQEALTWAKTDNLGIAIEVFKTIARTFAITLGGEGALVYDGTKLHRIDSYKVKPVDTSGAGDMFAGAFLFAITNGKDFLTAGKLASFASAAVVSDYGPRLSAMKQKTILKQWENIEI
jgi:sugar/nucleoside kinase (ribokinase family)